MRHDFLREAKTFVGRSNAVYFHAESMTHAGDYPVERLEVDNAPRGERSGNTAHL